MKDNIDWLQHDTDMGEHPKCEALIAAYGFEGYGRFNRLNELIGRAPQCRLDLSRKIYLNQVANKLQMKPQELHEFIQFLADPEECGLLKPVDNTVDNVWITDRTQENLESVMKTREREKQRRLKNDDTNGNRVDTNTNRDATQTTEQSTAHDTRSMHAAVSPQVLEEAIRGTPIRAGPEDLDRWTANLNAADLPADFVAWLYPTLHARPKVTKPAAICRTILDDLSKGTTEIREFQSAHSASPPTPSKPPPPEACDICGCTEIDEIDGQLRCAECARFWLLTNGEWIPDPDTGKPPDDGSDFETYQDTGKTPVGDDFPDDFELSEDADKPPPGDDIDLELDDFPGHQESG